MDDSFDGLVDPTLRRRWSPCRLVLARFSHRGVVASSMCRKERRPRCLRRGQLYDDRPPLPDVVAVARLVFARPTMARTKSATQRSTSIRISSTRLADPFVFNLFFQRSGQIFGQWMVGRFESVARSAPPAFHLAKADTTDLVVPRYCHASWNRSDDGDVSFRADHDRFERGCVWPGFRIQTKRRRQRS